MRPSRLLLLLLTVAVVLLPAGCPLGAPSDDGLPISGPASGTGGTGSGGGSGSSSSSSRPPVAAGGSSTSGSTTTDALSVEYPGCNEPLEAVFWRAEVLSLLNRQRTQRGLDPVTTNATLEAQASQYACEMVFYRFFAHVNPATGSTLGKRAEEFGYDYWIIGENLAAGQRTPAEVMADWMSSPCHRENILNPAFTEVGIGIRYGGEYGYYWVQEFGRPFSEDPYPGPAYHDPECSHDE